MLRSHRTMEAELQRVGTRWAARLEAEARAAVARHPTSLGGFAAAMGTVCFYAPDGMPLDDRSLPKRAAAVVAMGWDYTEAFGSPGIYLRKGGQPAKSKA